MPAWAGKWKGGRYYLDARGQRVFFIESNRKDVPRSLQLATHDEELAKAQLAAFRADAAGFLRSLAPPPLPEGAPDAVFITKERLTLYMESIHKCCEDHRKARRSYLKAWADLGLDLRTVDRKALRASLAEFTGGHGGRVEALNAFGRFLVREGDITSWNPLVNMRSADPEMARAERVAYEMDELRAAFGQLTDQPMRDLFFVRVATGMHHTEIAQIEGCKLYTGPLPDKGPGIRTLGGDHEIQIQGVVQVKHKTKARHRLSVSKSVLQAALRLREGVPSRFAAWNALTPLGIVPSNLRHTFTTLSGEMGRIISYKNAGVGLDEIAEILGHRVGSKMTGAKYDKLQIPKTMVLPLDWVRAL